MPIVPDDHFSPVAEAYSKGRLSYPSTLFDHLAGYCEERELAWDCATGSGQAVPELARRFRRVVATDISSELLSRAEKLPNVTYAKAPAESCGIAGGSVDLATVAQAIHWLDLGAFWAELRRVLRPRGVFAFWGYNWPEVNDRVDSVLGRLRLVLQPFWPGRSAVLHSGFRGLEAPFARLASPGFAIEASWTRADYLAHIQSWSAVRYCREAGRETILSDFQSQLSDVWREEERHRARWPLLLQVYRNEPPDASSQQS